MSPNAVSTSSSVCNGVRGICSTGRERFFITDPSDSFMVSHSKDYSYKRETERKVQMVLRRNWLRSRDAALRYVRVSVTGTDHPCPASYGVVSSYHPPDANDTHLQTSLSDRCLLHPTQPV